jgi:hypothetical protein
MAALSGVGLLVMLITDWPTDALNIFWADHSVLASIASTLLLIGIPYLLWESSESKQQKRLAAGLSGAGLGGIVDHIVDAEVALAMLSRGTPHEGVPWDSLDKPLKWLRALRPELRRLSTGRPCESDPRSLPVYLPDSEHSWRVALTDQALRRVLAAMRDWSPLIDRSDDGTTALIMLSEIRKDLMELSYELELGHTVKAEKLLLIQRQRLRILAHFFEDLSHNSSGEDAKRADTLFRPEVLLGLWPLPPVGEHLDWAADQEAVPSFSRLWQIRLASVMETLDRDALSPMSAAEARQLAIYRHAGQVNKQAWTTSRHISNPSRRASRTKAKAPRSRACCTTSSKTRGRPSTTYWLSALRPRSCMLSTP